MTRFWTAAADLFLGADCPGCGRPAITWCRACATTVRPDPRIVGVPGLGVPAAAAGANAETLRAMLIAWKEHGRHGLLEPFADLLSSALCLLDPPARVALVPVPSEPRAVRRRGADVVAELAECAASRLVATGTEAAVVRALGRSRRTRDQANLGVAERRANLSGAFLAGRGAGRAIVVDDILTTGSTAQEAVRALASTGWIPLGVAVVGHTPAPSAQVRKSGS